MRCLVSWMYNFIFVSDFFADEYSGGSELTSEAIIGNKSDIHKMKSKNLTQDFIENNKEKIWIFGNFSLIPAKVLLLLCKSDLTYHIIEYDFKFCKFRSPEKHSEIEGSCNCIKESNGKLVSIFFNNAEKLWFMSKRQSLIYKEKMPFLKDDKIKVLSSIFDKKHLQEMLRLNKDVKKTNDNFLILNSSSWIKGTNDCISYAKENNLQYEIVSGLPYEKILRKMRESKGLIFLPKAPDTCPRIVIEAKILGCELHLNENVLHKDEEWFRDEKIMKYLKNRREYFWSGLES